MAPIRSSRRTATQGSTRSSGRAAGSTDRRSSSGRTASSGTSSRSTRSHAGRPEERGSDRRGGREKKADNTLVYVAVGSVALGIVILGLCASSSGSSESIKKVSQAQSAEEQFSGPFKSEDEARRALAKAHNLVAEGSETSGSRRNQCYAEAKRLCEQILTSPVSEKLKEDANKLLYHAFKHQTTR
jgi:hypothetical protein